MDGGKEMKYSKEEYENAEIYAGEDEILNYKSKIVKTRKNSYMQSLSKRNCTR